MNPAIRFLCCSSFIWAFTLSHAKHSPHLPPVSLHASSRGMQTVVQDKHAHLEKEIILAIVLASIAISLVILSAFCACFIWRRYGLKTGTQNAQVSGIMHANEIFHHLDTSGGFPTGPVLNRFNPLSIRGSIPDVEYSLIEAATNDFSDRCIVGKSGHALLYKAHFNFGSLAVVKKLDCKELHCERAFENEIVLLSNIMHPNIVSILGYCVLGEARLLLFELMQNGSLESQLHGPSSGSRLTWHIRMKIALDAARGLEYLHEHCDPPVVHRAIKSANILLDSSFNAKISEFGLATARGNGDEHRVKPSDSRGHVAPEYLINGKLTEKSDVYSFGVVLLELLMGRKSIDITTRAQGQSGIMWAMPQLIDRERLPDLVDPVIGHTMDQKHLCQVAAVAVLCVQQEPSYRPLITDVVYSLIPLVPIELGGTLRV